MLSQGHSERGNSVKTFSQPLVRSSHPVHNFADGSQPISFSALAHVYRRSAPDTRMTIHQILNVAVASVWYSEEIAKTQLSPDMLDVA